MEVKISIAVLDNAAEKWTPCKEGEERHQKHPRPLALGPPLPQSGLSFGVFDGS